MLHGGPAAQPHMRAMNLDVSRAAGLQQLAAVTPFLGRHYASHRNAEPGPGEAPATSVLSPYLRRRLLLESEAVAAALAAHGPERAGKFADEVFWQTYFKGYLATHPSAWTGYLAEVAAGRQRLATEAGLRRGDVIRLETSAGAVSARQQPGRRPRAASTSVAATLSEPRARSQTASHGCSRSTVAP